MLFQRDCFVQPYIYFWLKQVKYPPTFKFHATTWLPSYIANLAIFCSFHNPKSSSFKSFSSLILISWTPKKLSPADPTLAIIQQVLPLIWNHPPSHTFKLHSRILAKTPFIAFHSHHAYLQTVNNFEMYWQVSKVSPATSNTNPKPLLMLFRIYTSTLQCTATFTQHEAITFSQR